MRFDASQQMRMGQHMKLAPRMIQSMEILQMPLLQLEERIAQELESNVTLEVDEDGGGPAAASADAEGEDQDLGQTVAESAASDELNEDAGEGEEGGSAGEHDAADTGDSAVAGDELPISVDETSARDDFERLDSFESDNPEAAENEYDERAEERPDTFDLDRLASRETPTGDPDAKSLAMANTASRSASMAEQLREQWGLADVEEELRPLGEHIIAFIDDDGYVREPLATILDRLPAASAQNGNAQTSPTIARMEQALQAVQLLLDPPGVAARNTRECLLLQVDAILDEKRGTGGWGVDGGGEGGAMNPAERERWLSVRRLIADHLDDLAQNRLPRIAEKTGLTLVDEPPGVVVPDAIVEYDTDADRYVCYLNDNRLPHLRINQEYARLAKDRTAPAPTREFIKKNLSNASWLLDAVEQRRRTLLRVVNSVVAAQREYFDYGPQALRPLPMTQVAEQLGIHVATVSRAVAEKYLLTPRGVVPLRGFFSGGTQTQSGEDLSWDAVKAALKEIIDAENKADPLNDDELAAQLLERGIEIARRTVAKYRDQLGVPSARLRKTF